MNRGALPVSNACALFSVDARALPVPTAPVAPAAAQAPSAPISLGMASNPQSFWQALLLALVGQWEDETKDRLSCLWTLVDH